MARFPNGAIVHKVLVQLRLLHFAPVILVRESDVMQRKTQLFSTSKLR